MSLLEILQLVGYSTAAALHLWIGGLLVKRRRSLGRIERVLMPLALLLGAWHASNLLVSLHSMLGLSVERWTPLLRAADTLAVTSVTLTYSLLLHVHLHLWADARGRALTWTERARVYLSYLPAVFLAYALPKLWAGAYAPMFVKLSQLLLPFALWAAYVLCLVAGTDFLIARLSRSRSERLLMRTLSAAFVGIAALIISVYALGVGEGAAAGEYLKTFANLASLVPTALLAYHIYRYRYLELLIKESLIVASFAGVVLVVYLYGIRTVSLWLTARYGLRAAAVESLFILMLALVASPLRRWLDKRFRQLFEQEAALFRDVVARIGASAGRYKELPELLRFVEERASSGLGLKRVRILTAAESNTDAGQAEIDFHPNGDGVCEVGEGKAEGWVAELIERSRAGGWLPVEGVGELRERGWEIAYPLLRESRVVGLMLVESSPDALTYDVRSVLEMLAGQVAVAVEDCRLVEENVRLERRISQSERLAALGRMAATVAHEVKNPLSAIKSIAQVMREDDYLKREYTRDLDLIVGETDRLSRSVTQMLSFARTAPHGEAPRRAAELLRSLVQLFKSDASARGVSVEAELEGADVELDGPRAAAVRDAVSNLLVNAVQATPTGGRVAVEARVEESVLKISVVDSGPGVSAEHRARIWEPFFTTKQRGTGLGLAIVRKRVEEAGGAAELLPQQSGEGARFELRLPVE
ncbi:MAG TPA: ATP-binding protein [Pyrinomonadaceae bacterium]|jgi:signal transduction histidine kinase|nr:ATP-binding protein [Pyrinomonadaceae bacterium]